jgi:hypothetical protein
VAPDRLAIYRDLLRETEESIERVQRQMRTLELEQKGLEDERAVLRRVVERHERQAQFRQRRQGSLPLNRLPEKRSPPTVASNVPGLPTEDDWRPLSRSDAVERVLRAAGAPLDRGEVVKRLVEKGRTEDGANDVSATLSYLQRHTRVRQVPPSLWAWVPPEERQRRKKLKAAAPRMAARRDAGRGSGDQARAETGSTEEGG